ncbi:NUDIX domain-containing protein [Saccharothrix ecbatanensis]|uniref:NUDIX domain-containing protein n=1 Tax=Saccharothrix ecbatanensis TaxID=1105145 RepID=UPI0028A7B761|nr:NUDIX domain-containing protein [Saccharothrix ecbatanensis]
MLLVRDQHDSAFRLPGGLVGRPGEAVHDALRRTLAEHLNAGIVRLDFFAAVEHHTQNDPNGRPVHEVALLFDLTLTEPVPAASSGCELRWATDAALREIDLRPAAIADRLRSSALTANDVWWSAVT